MGATKLRTPASATISASLASLTAPFAERCREQHAAFLRSEADRARAMAEWGPSKAFAAAEAAMAEHARRWAQARRDVMAETGCTETPARDRRPHLKGYPS